MSTDPRQLADRDWRTAAQNFLREYERVPLGSPAAAEFARALLTALEERDRYQEVLAPLIANSFTMSPRTEAERASFAAVMEVVARARKLGLYDKPRAALAVKEKPE